jgi:hypothetical protein
VVADDGEFREECVMTGKAAVFLSSIVIVGSAMLAGACGSGSDDSTGVVATPGSETASPTIADTASREMLQAMMPGAADLPGFTLSDARFVDNEGASVRAPDPAARLARLNEMGRVVGFHAIFVASEGAPAGGPTTILWSVNLFQQPAGALEFINEPSDVTEGVTLEPLDVSSLGPNAVGFVLRSSDPAKPAFEYGVAFAEGTVESGVVALYGGTDSSPDYILSLGQQARALVESGMGSGSAPQAPLEGAPAAAEAVPTAAPTDIPGGITVPIRAVVGTPEP